MCQEKLVLPDGKEDPRYLNVDQEWPTLYTRLGKPRILRNFYMAEVMEYVKQKDNPDEFSFLDAGCGHGNDLRAIIKLLDGRGHFLGIDISQSGIIRGIHFYQESENENPKEAIKLFGLGNLQNLNQILIWDVDDQSFSSVRHLRDEEFDLVYTEAVLHAFGYGYKYYYQKKEAAQKALNELFRICRKEGMYFGRMTAFSSSISKEEQFRCLIDEEDWRFIPEAKEFFEMLKQAGFSEIKRMIRPHEKAEIDFSKKDMLNISFLVRK